MAITPAIRNASWFFVAIGAVLTALSAYPTREGLIMAACSVCCSAFARFLARHGH